MVITFKKYSIYLSNYYKNNGFLDVEVFSKIEYLKSNKVNLFFYITEGPLYTLSEIRIDDSSNIINNDITKLIDNEINKFLNQEKIFSTEKIKNLEKKLTSIIFENDLEFFEIKAFEKKENNEVDILFQILPILPKYTNQINIVGNSRTFDNVIRRELEIVEGDAIYETQIQSIRDKLVSLNLFESVNIKQEQLKDNKINLIIDVEEKQTGTFNAGVSIGTLDGFQLLLD